MTALELAISRLIPPTQAELARLIGKHPQQINRWIKKNTPLPAEFCIKVEAVSGVSRHVLRPDVFGTTSEAA